MNRILGSSEKIKAVRLGESYRLIIISKPVTFINSRKFTQLNDAVSRLRRIKERNSISEKYWASSNELPQGNYLFRINNKKQKVHIWNGEDTLCKMWSTGGINSNSKDFSLFNSTMDKETCSLCLGKLQSSHEFFPEDTNDNSIIKIKHLHIANDEQYDRKEEIYIYILQLSNGYFYVGQTVNPSSRIKKQFSGKGSSWTKLNPPKSVISIVKAGTKNWKEAEQIENKTTLNLMIKHGWKNVRGGFWCNRDQDTTFNALSNHREYIEGLGCQYSSVIKM